MSSCILATPTLMTPKCTSVLLLGLQSIVMSLSVWLCVCLSVHAHNSKTMWPTLRTGQSNKCHRKLIYQNASMSENKKQHQLRWGGELGAVWARKQVTALAVTTTTNTSQALPHMSRNERPQRINNSTDLLLWIHRAKYNDRTTNQQWEENVWACCKLPYKV